MWFRAYRLSNITSFFVMGSGSSSFEKLEMNYGVDETTQFFTCSVSDNNDLRVATILDFGMWLVYGT